MGDYEQNQEVMRNDLDQLKEQVSRLVESMQAMERRRDADRSPPVANQEPQATPIHPPGFCPLPPQYFLNPQGIMMPITMYPHNSTQPPITNPRDTQALPIPPYGPPFVYIPPHTTNLQESNIPVVTPESNPQNTPQPQILHTQRNTPTPHPTPIVVPPVHPLQVVEEPLQNISTEVSLPKTKLQALEERLSAIEGEGVHGLGDAIDLCLVPDVVIPPKFKVPDFDKYQGITCPRNHLTMYCRKMVAYAHDDKLLIHVFQDSLTGAALSWYMHLERSQICSWKDLADAFLKRYKYNVGMAPDRMQLQNMAKKDEEAFKEYAQRWREIAAQVEPPLSEKEMVAMFVDTLQSPFYDMVIGSVSSNFSDMVTIGERVESGMRSGKIVYNGTINAKKPEAELPKNEGETHAVSSDQGGYNQKRLNHLLGNPNLNPNQRKSSKQKKRSVQFDPIPMSYTELLPYLIHQSLIVPSPMKPIEPPYPREYDPNAKCDYHSGAIGHSTENCRTLKHKIQDMINAGWLNFDGNNPLPSHEGPLTDVIEGSPPVVPNGAFET